jgi:ribosomal protein L37AE/L43A
MDWNLFDETFSKFGLLKVLRDGNGFEWRVYGVHNFERPLFVGKAGQFEEARKQGEDKLYKDLKQIFWILSQMSEKERKEGEPVDAEIIERAIREINAGRKSQAIVYLREIINREKAEGEPDDVRQLELALALLMSEPPDLGKSEVPQPPIERPEMKSGETDWQRENNIKRTHPPSGLPRYVCTICSMPVDFTDEGGLIPHNHATKAVRFMRALSGVKKGTTYEPCPTCSSGHLGLKGGKPRDLKCPDCGGTGQKVTQKAGQIFTCDECGAEFNSLPGLKVHMTDHFGEKSLEDDFGADSQGHEYYDGDKHLYHCKLCGCHEDSPNATNPCRNAKKAVEKDACAVCGKPATREEEDGTRVCSKCFKQRNGQTKGVRVVRALVGKKR